MSTLKDVAKLANVDVSTASRALNGKSYVQEETKLRILNAAKQLNYSPNLLAKNLREGKSKTIAVIVPSISLNIFADITYYIEIECRKLGYNTIISNTQDDPSIEANCLKHLSKGFVDAIAIASCGKNKKLIKEIHKRGIPIIQIIRKYDNTISSVAANYKIIGYDGTKYLISKGCKHIGLINGSKYIIPYKERYDGYKKAITENNYQENVAEITTLDFLEGSYNAVHSLLERNPNIDGILVSTDMQGIGVMRALKNKKIKVPQQIKIISLTGNYIGAWLETAITSVEIPAKEIGKKIANIIIENIKNKKNTTNHIVFEPHLVERETT